MEQQKEYYAFISYKREDKKEANSCSMPWSTIACLIICNRRIRHSSVCPKKQASMRLEKRIYYNVTFLVQQEIIRK